MTVLLAGTVMVCPNCDVRAAPQSAALNPGDGAAQFHHCVALGILAPLVPEGQRAKVEKVERDDYVGDETLRYDDTGRPIMSVVTTRDDGQDCVVFAPLAKVSLNG